ncbi:MAG TPA: hypothetical protein VNK67_03375 [Burkholderiales bacterium]|nr:hypothetical protein [Burkholderiales bacterium]
MKLMKGHQQKAASPGPPENAEQEPVQAQGLRSAAESGSCCSVASELMRALGTKEKKEA